MFISDYILNGSGFGQVGEGLAGVRFETGLLRPYFGPDGRKYCDVTVNGKKEARLVSDLVRNGYESPVVNATSLRKDEWIQMDNAVVRAYRQRLRAWSDLAAANSFGGFNGMGKATLEYEAMSDPGEAVVDMDMLSDGRTDNPLYVLRSIPLPITHSDFWFSERRLAISRNSGTPLDTTMAEAAGRRIAEMVEKTVIGVETGVTYGPNTSTDTRYDSGVASKVYGYTNFPYRLTSVTLTAPTGSNPEVVMGNVISLREALYAQGFYGPFMLYHTPGYDRYLDDDYYRSGGTSVTRTLRERIASIDGIAGIRRLDYWTGTTYQMVLVQMTSDVARAIIGMPITTVQWESQGGLRKNWKVMCIMVPQLRADYTGKTGIIHATT